MCSPVKAHLTKATNPCQTRTDTERTKRALGLAVLTTKKIKHYNANRENIRVIARGVERERERKRERE